MYRIDSLVYRIVNIAILYHLRCIASLALFNCVTKWNSARRWRTHLQWGLLSSCWGWWQPLKEATTFHHRELPEKILAPIHSFLKATGFIFIFSFNCIFYVNHNIVHISLPVERERCSVANGQLATIVYSDTVYMNGLYNGQRGNSHRARYIIFIYKERLGSYICWCIYKRIECMFFPP